MTQQISITIQEQALQVPLVKLLSLLANPGQEIAGTLMQADPYLHCTPSLPAEIGAELEGGIYVGPRVENGRLIHLIAAKKAIGKFEWDKAQAASSDYEGEDCGDWFLPSKEDMQVALTNAQNLFDKDEWHWTSTPFGSYYAWAVDFERGYVGNWGRYREFLVCPFRRLSI